MSQLKYTAKVRSVILMILKIERKDRKIIREMKQEEDHSFYYLDGNACSMQCERMIGSMSMAHEPWTTFGRITQPRVLTSDNAWSCQRDWRREDDDQFYAYNHLTEERRPITQEQYNNDNTITDDGRLAI